MLRAALARCLGLLLPLPPVLRRQRPFCGLLIAPERGEKGRALPGWGKAPDGSFLPAVEHPERRQLGAVGIG